MIFSNKNLIIETNIEVYNMWIIQMLSKVTNSVINILLKLITVKKCKNHKITLSTTNKQY